MKTNFETWRKGKISDKAWKNIKRALSIVLIISFGVLVASVTWSITYERYAPKDVPLVAEDPVTKVLVRGTVITNDETGFLVELDEDSSFSGLRVYIPYNDNYPKFHTKDYLDIYYNGVIIDTSPARLQTIYSIERYAVDIKELNQWKQSTRKLEDFVYVGTIRPLIESTLNVDQEITQEIIAGEDTTSKNIIAVLVYIYSPNDNDCGWKMYYIQRNDNDYKLIYQNNILLPVEQLEQ